MIAFLFQALYLYSSYDFSFRPKFSNQTDQVTLGHVVDRKMREMGYIRKLAVDELKNRRSLRERVAAERTPEASRTKQRTC